MPVVRHAEAYLVLGQPEHRLGLAWEFLFLGCYAGMSPCQVALALGYFLHTWTKSQSNGARVSEKGDFIQRVPQTSVALQGKGEAFPLGKATEVTR